MNGHIRKRSPGSHELRWRANGRPVTKTVRGSRKDAQRALRAALTAVDTGTHVEPSKLTVAQHVRARIDQWHGSGQIRTRAAENYTYLLGLIATGLGPILVQRLTTLDIERWHAEMIGRGLAPRTVRITHALLARALADAVKHRLVVRNVAREQGAPKAEPAGRVTTPDGEQVQALLNGLAGDPWHAPVLIALYCGLRRGEQLALRWTNVDLPGAKLHVVEALDETRAGITVKGPKSAAGRRTITLTSNVVDALRQHRQAQLERRLLLGLGRPPDNALVFPGRDGGHVSPNLFTKRWARRAARLGMPGVTWHSLRHAHASMLIAAGVPITTVAARLGHGDPAITLRVYAHLFTKDDAAAAEAIERALGL